MKEKLSDLCREQKQTITPHKTNQDVAENTDLSVGTVSRRPSRRGVSRNVIGGKPNAALISSPLPQGRE